MTNTTTYDNIRLSKHFVLLDFMSSHDVYTYGHPLPVKQIVTDEHIANATRLCLNLLEPMIEKYGPCSVAAGFWPKQVRTDYGHHYASPHKWDNDAAAADVCFHDWVNADRSPISLLWDMDQDETFNCDRAISYGGSEFTCLTYKHGSSRGALYENRMLDPKTSPKYISHGTSQKDRARRAGTPAPDLLKWRRDSDDPVYHTGKRLRAQHIRTGQYFNLLDFCKNSIALTRGFCMVPPLKSAAQQIRVARMFSEVMDPLVKQLGRVSVVRGCEPKWFMSEDEISLQHRWIPNLSEGIYRCVFLLPLGACPRDAEEILFKHPHVKQVTAKNYGEGSLIELTINKFKPRQIWNSWS